MLFLQSEKWSARVTFCGKDLCVIANAFVVREMSRLVSFGKPIWFSTSNRRRQSQHERMGSADSGEDSTGVVYGWHLFSY